jgi:hypothetical protein
MVGSKMICQNWHFGQVEHGGKKNIWRILISIRVTSDFQEIKELVNGTLS